MDMIRVARPIEEDVEVGSSLTKGACPGIASKWDLPTAGKHNIPRLGGIFLDSSGSRLYVTDCLNSEVLKMNMRRGSTAWTSLGGFGDDLGSLNFPMGLHATDDGWIYIADYGNNRIVRWRFGVARGSLVVGEDLDRPHALTIEQHERNNISFKRLFVADKNAIRMYSHGHGYGEALLGQILMQAKTPGGRHKYTLAFAGGRLYGCLDHRLRIFDDEGKVVPKGTDEIPDWKCDSVNTVLTRDTILVSLGHAARLINDDKVLWEHDGGLVTMSKKWALEGSSRQDDNTYQVREMTVIESANVDKALFAYVENEDGTVDTNVVLREKKEDEKVIQKRKEREEKKRAEDKQHAAMEMDEKRRRAEEFIKAEL